MALPELQYYGADPVSFAGGDLTGFAGADPNSFGGSGWGNYGGGAGGVFDITGMAGADPNSFGGFDSWYGEPWSDPFAGSTGAMDSFNPSWLTSLAPIFAQQGGGGMDWSKLLGPAATAAGALAGAQGQDASTSATQRLPDYLQAPVGDLVGRSQELLGAQMPSAYESGQRMIQGGRDLLSGPVAGNGYGQVQLNAPQASTNPYLSGMADDIGRRTQDLLYENNLAIQGNSVASGGLGGSRQGVAQGIAAGKAADSLQGQLAGLFGQQYSNDQNRALQQYQADQGFYGQQRGQDLTQVGVGGGLLSKGYDTQFAPLRSATDAYSPFTGFGTKTTSGQEGGGWGSAAGGALSGAALARQMKWW